MWWIILIIVIIGVLIVGYVVFRKMVELGALGLTMALSAAFEPDSPESQLRIFSKNLLDFNFADGSYEIIEAVSRNSHPDRPQKLTIKLSDEEFDRLKAHINILPERNENIEGNDSNLRIVTKLDNSCSIEQSSTHLDCDYLFFKATAEIDYLTKTISFKSTFF